VGIRINLNHYLRKIFVKTVNKNISMENKKIYCGSGRIIKTKFGDLPKISFHKDDINKIVKYMKDNNLTWINLEMPEKREKIEGKPTHYIQVDTWKPEQKNEISKDKDTEDLPF
jgi:hypothetical protein